MRREIDILPTPTSLKFTGLSLSFSRWTRSALALAAGVGFAIFLFGLAHSPFANSPRRR